MQISFSIQMPDIMGLPQQHTTEGSGDSGAWYTYTSSYDK